MWSGEPSKPERFAPHAPRLLAVRLHRASRTRYDEHLHAGQVVISEQSTRLLRDGGRALLRRQQQLRGQLEGLRVLHHTGERGGVVALRRRHQSSLNGLLQTIPQLWEGLERGARAVVSTRMQGRS